MLPLCRRAVETLRSSSIRKVGEGNHIDTGGDTWPSLRASADEQESTNAANQADFYIPLITGK